MPLGHPLFPWPEAKQRVRAAVFPPPSVWLLLKLKPSMLSSFNSQFIVEREERSCPVIKFSDGSPLRKAVKRYYQEGGVPEECELGPFFHVRCAQAISQLWGQVP